MEQQISSLQNLINTLTSFGVAYSFQVLGAIIILIAGNLLAKWVANIIFNLGQKRKMDITLNKFMASTAKVLIMTFVVLIALGKFGITIAPFIAALGAAAFGATYAIQGPLSNYAAGLSIILGRPFVVGNTISVAGVNGVVQEVKMANTLLITEDGVKITVPNKHIVGEIIHNSRENKVVEGSVGIGYECDPERAILIIKDILAKDPDVVKDPLPQVGLKSFGESSLDIGFRYWVPTMRYFQVGWGINVDILKSLQKANISIPFPQREVKIIPEGVEIKR